MEDARRRVAVTPWSRRRPTSRPRAGHLVEEKKRIDPHFADVFDEAFGEISYWDDKYKQRAAANDEFDWFISFQDAQGVLEPLIRRDAKILVPGCGDAPFSRDLCAAGYEHLCNVDASDVVIERMRAASASASLPATVEWKVMDCRRLDLEADAFDAVVDKALLDCVRCRTDGRLAAADVLREFHRVLKPGGTLIVFSAHTRASLEQIFDEVDLSWYFGHVGFESADAGKPFLLSVVICEKHAPGAGEDGQARFAARLERAFSG